MEPGKGDQVGKARCLKPPPPGGQKGPTLSQNQCLNQVRTRGSCDFGSFERRPDPGAQPGRETMSPGHETRARYRPDEVLRLRIQPPAGWRHRASIGQGCRTPQVASSQESVRVRWPRPCRQRYHDSICPGSDLVSDPNPLPSDSHRRPVWCPAPVSVETTHHKDGHLGVGRPTARAHPSPNESERQTRHQESGLPSKSKTETQESHCARYRASLTGPRKQDSRQTGESRRQCRPKPRIHTTEDGADGGDLSDFCRVRRLPALGGRIELA